MAPRIASAQSGGAGGGGGGEAGQGGANTQLPPWPELTSVLPNEVVRNSPVRIEGKNLPAAKEAIEIQLGQFKIGHPSFVAADQRSFIFSVPEQAETSAGLVPIPIGPELLLRITVGVDPNKYSGVTVVPFTEGYLHVVSETRAPLKLLGIEPQVINPKTSTLTLIGEGLGGPGGDFTLLRDGRSVELCTEGKCDQPSFDSNSPFQITFKLPTGQHEGLSADWLGKHTISLRRGEGPVQDAKGRVIAGIDVNVIECTPLTIKIWAWVVSGSVLLLIGAIAFWGAPKRVLRVPGAPKKDLTYALLVDPATDTYSLSMLQFYLWSVAALVAYAYLTISRALAQGHLDIADVPENLPGILAISAGTSVASLGVTAMKGSKGAGDMPPKFSDLISVGGAVALERFQYLLWTFVAILTFLFYVFRTDPTVIADLPVIPSRLLMLSGISAAGYLGGKIARPAGPIIDEILAKIGSLDLTILGTNLSRQAKIEIEKVSATPFLDPGAHPDHRPKGSGDDDLCETLELKLAAAPLEWTTADALKVTVTNPDGQLATWAVSIPADTKAAIAALPRSIPQGSGTPS